MLAVPNIKGCDADVTLKGMDVAPLISDEPSLRQLGQVRTLVMAGAGTLKALAAFSVSRNSFTSGMLQSGQPVRMRLTGNAKVLGAVRQADSNSSTNGWNLDGTLGLENLRLNQLKVFKKLEGTFEVGRDTVYVWLH
jgi:hypothetical protein